MKKEAPPNAFIARYRDRASDIDWHKVAKGGIAAAVGLGVAGYAMLGLFGGGDEEEQVATAQAPTSTLSLPQRKYSDLQGEAQQIAVRPPAAPPPPAQDETKHEPPAKREPAQVSGGEVRRAAPKDDLLEKAIAADIVLVKGEGPVGVVPVAHRSGGGDGSDFVAGAECQVDAGTAIPAVLDTAISSGLTGTVRARVTADVWDTATGTCLAIPSGSVFVGDAKRTELRGQKRAEIEFYMLTRPSRPGAPNGDTLKIKAPVSDATGRAGMAGRVNTNAAGQAGLVLASTAVDIATAALAGGPFGVLGVLLGNADRPINKAARDQLDRPSVIEIDPTRDGRKAQLTLILREHINGDDFRN